MGIKLKKIFKRTFLAFVGIILFLLLSCYFLLHYRVKYVIRQIVRIETNDAYDIDFSDLSLSLLSGNVKIKNASFHSKKADSSQTSYKVRVPEFYFSLKSWRPLFSQKQLIVDSLYIGQPEISILQFKEASDTNKAAFEVHSIYEILTQTATNLNVRALQIKEATIYLYPSYSSSYSLKIDHINFRIANFERRQKEARRFLLSDDVDLRIRNQHWVLSNGNSIDFSNLHFSGRDQHFEIDSCLLKTADKESGNSVEIRASKFFFTSSRLTSAYLEEKLLIDTLSCINPVVQLRRGNKNEPEDTVSLLAHSLIQLFDEIHFKYINIVDGQLSLLHKDDDKLTNYQSQKINLRLYDLDIHSGNLSSFSLRDIEFQLDTIRFLSPDSAYVLNVGRFSINDGDLTCENATFVPFNKDDVNGGMRLTLPQITLKSVSLEELLQKRLKATYAQFNNPDIFVSGGQLKNKKKQKVKVVDALYAALHGLSSLINVETMYVNHGKLHYLNRDNNVAVNATNMTAAIGLNDLFQSDSLVNIKAALRQMSFDVFTLRSPQLRLGLKKVNVQGTIRGTHVDSAVIELTNEMSIKANQIFWSKLDWDVLYNQKKIAVDRVSLGRLDVQYKQAALNAEMPHRHAPFFASNSFYIEDLRIAIALRNGTKLNTKGNGLLVSNVRNNENGLEWEDIRSRFENSIYSKAGVKIIAEASLIDKRKGTLLKNVTISANKNELWLPEVKLATTINNTKLSNLHLQYLVINEPTISVNAGESENDQGETRIPFNLDVDKMEINKAMIRYISKQGDSLRFTVLANVTVDSLQMLKDGTNALSYPSLMMRLTDAEIANRKITVDIPEVNVRLSRSVLHKTPKGKPGFEADTKLQWINASVKGTDGSEYVQQASNLSGEFTYPGLYLEGGKKIVLKDLIDRIKINNGSLFYSNAARTIIADKLTLDVGKGNLEMENIHIKPNMSRDTFFQTSEWQKDYMVIHCDKLSLENFDIRKYLEDSAIDIREVTVENASLVTSRDKTISFEHGIEKLMPTKLIQSIKRPFHIQRVIVKNANITANEISVTTKREGSVPFISVNGEIRNINNSPSPADSLSVYANAIFLDHHIRTMRYKESYTDSLSGFHMVVKISPMDLTALSKITSPLAALEIEKGRSDTLFERIAGNKYAAFGEMKFYYHDLKIKTLDPIDTAKKNLVLSFKNFAVNKFIVKTNNKRYSSIFFIRDQERFVFNYWVKATLSGVITSTGIKNNKKYLKQYDKVKDGYSLPPWE